MNKNYKSVSAKKEWTKPAFMTISSEELKKHIQGAARSGACPGWGR